MQSIRSGRVMCAVGVLLLTGIITVLTIRSDAAAATGSGYFIQDVRVFDGYNVISNTNVLVSGEYILDVGSGLQAPLGVTVIDGAGKTLIPGLIDSHTHLFTINDLREALLFGVTTEAGMGVGAEAGLLALQACIGFSSDRADLVGASQIATVPGGHGSQYGSVTLSSPNEAHDYVDARIAEGAGYIKMVQDDLYLLGEHVAPWPTFSKPTAKAVIQATHDRGLLVIAHATQTADAIYLAQHGLDGLAHGVLDNAVGSDLAHHLKKNNAFVIATLSVFHAIDGASVATEPLDDALLSPWLTPNAMFWLTFPFSPALHELWDFEAPLANVTWMHQQGVPLLAGTDTPNVTAHGASMHVELELLVAAGLSPSEALTAATATPATVFGLNDRGRIAPGLLADMVLVNGDPTADIMVTRDIATIWRRGTLVDRDVQFALAIYGDTPTCP